MIWSGGCRALLFTKNDVAWYFVNNNALHNPYLAGPPCSTTHDCASFGVNGF